MQKSSKAMAAVVAVLGIVITWFFGSLILKDGIAFVRLLGVVLGLGLVVLSVYQIFFQDRGEEEYEEEEDF